MQIGKLNFSDKKSSRFLVHFSLKSLRVLVFEMIFLTLIVNYDRH